MSKAQEININSHEKTKERKTQPNIKLLIEKISTVKRINHKEWARGTAWLARSADKNVSRDWRLHKPGGRRFND